MFPGFGNVGKGGGDSRGGLKNLIKKTAAQKTGIAKLTKESRLKKRQKYNLFYRFNVSSVKFGQ